MDKEAIGSKFPTAFSNLWPVSREPDGHDVYEQLIAGQAPERIHEWRLVNPPLEAYSGPTTLERPTKSSDLQARISALESDTSFVKHDMSELKELILTLIARLPLSPPNETTEESDASPTLVTPGDRAKIKRYHHRPKKRGFVAPHFEVDPFE